VKTWQRIVIGSFYTMLLISLALWFWVTGTVCGEPAQLEIATHHIIPYNCHGRTVFITPFENAVLHWLIPIFFMLMIALKYLRDRWHKQA